MPPSGFVAGYPGAKDQPARQPVDRAEPMRQPVKQSAPEPFEEREAERDHPPRPQSFNDGYTQVSAEPEGKYRQLSSGKRVASVFLCIFMALVMLFTIGDVALRVTLTEENIREASTYEKMMEKDAITEYGPMPVVDYLLELIDSNPSQTSSIGRALLKIALSNEKLSNLVANIMTDFFGFFLRDEEPVVLNADTIITVLEDINLIVSTLAGREIQVFDVEAIAEKINGGPLSFLSIDINGGWFLKKYGVNPRLPATILSLPVLIICGVILLLCLVMVFVINSSNAPAGLNFNGVVMIIDGGFCLLTALGLLIIALVKDLWIVSELMMKAAMWMGCISAGLLIIGMIFVIIAKSLRKRAREKALADELTPQFI